MTTLSVRHLARKLAACIDTGCASSPDLAAALHAAITSEIRRELARRCPHGVYPNWCQLADCHDSACSCHDPETGADCYAQPPRGSSPGQSHLVVAAASAPTDAALRAIAERPCIRTYHVEDAPTVGKQCAEWWPENPNAWCDRCIAAHALQANGG